MVPDKWTGLRLLNDSDCPRTPGKRGQACSPDLISSPGASPIGVVRQTTAVGQTYPMDHEQGIPRPDAIPERIGIVGGSVPGELRLVDAETLVRLRRVGEEIGLSGRWSSDWLDRNLARGVTFPIHVALINNASVGPRAPIQGRCFRCLAYTQLVGTGRSTFQIDIDSVDFERLPIMSPGAIRELAHQLIDEDDLDGVWHSDRTLRVVDESSDREIQVRVEVPDSSVVLTVSDGNNTLFNASLQARDVRDLARTFRAAAERSEKEFR